MINRRNFQWCIKTYPSREVASSLVERASTRTFSGSKIAGALTLVLPVCTEILFESINRYINMQIKNQINM